MANAPFAAIGDYRDIQTLNYSAVLTSLSGQAPLLPPPDLKLRPWESVIWRRAR